MTPRREGAGEGETGSQRAQPLGLAQGRARGIRGESQCLSKGVQDPLRLGKGQSAGSNLKPIIEPKVTDMQVQKISHLGVTAMYNTDSAARGTWRHKG